MSDYYPGQHVVCVDDVGETLDGKRYKSLNIKVGTVYTVAKASYRRHNVVDTNTGRVVRVSTQDPQLLITLAEVPVKRTHRGAVIVEDDPWFSASRFRPLRRITPEEFTGELTPVEITKLLEKT